MEWLQNQYMVAYAALAQIDPAIMNGILIGSLGVGFVLGVYYIGRAIGNIKIIRRWGEARTMKRKRQAILDQLLADDIEEMLDQRLTKGHVTDQEHEQLRQRCARRLNLPDLIPRKDADTVKRGILYRLTYTGIYKKVKIPGPKPGEKEGKPTQTKVQVFAA